LKNIILRGEENGLMTRHLDLDSTSHNVYFTTLFNVIDITIDAGELIPLFAIISIIFDLHSPLKAS
jgi:hypothetical protein